RSKGREAAEVGRAQRGKLLTAAAHRLDVTGVPEVPRVADRGDESGCALRGAVHGLAAIQRGRRHAGRALLAEAAAGQVREALAVEAGLTLGALAVRPTGLEHAPRGRAVGVPPRLTGAIPLVAAILVRLAGQVAVAAGTDARRTGLAGAALRLRVTGALLHHAAHLPVLDLLAVVVLAAGVRLGVTHTGMIRAGEGHLGTGRFGIRPTRTTGTHGQHEEHQGHGRATGGGRRLHKAAKPSPPAHRTKAPHVTAATRRCDALRRDPGGSGGAEGRRGPGAALPSPRGDVSGPGRAVGPPASPDGAPPGATPPGSARACTPHPRPRRSRSRGSGSRRCRR